MEKVIELKNVTKKFGERVVLNNISLTICKGDYISIAGESGAGKSTLMNILGCLDREFLGEYFFQNQKLLRKDYNTFRNEHIGFIFQQYHLIPNISVKENIMLPYVYCKQKIPRIKERIEELLIRFHMEALCEQQVNTLSGGEKQRVALIRSMILEPDIILADEPTGNLDDVNGRLIRDFLLERNREGKTIIVVTHDMSFAAEARRQFYIKDGGINVYQKMA